ncbi:hypothetical protein AKJ09_10192 [Labilithrix luteola]|uniref:Uncharacterized protein n=1 Tax=Labilithrix luteola TaxID=1391654 RepID=A0A0K1QCQ5_9BACT|nr:hypothetical protein AKJ09_10192 [Labilithrix luteola]
MSPEQIRSLVAVDARSDVWPDARKEPKRSPSPAAGNNPLLL